MVEVNIVTYYRYYRHSFVDQSSNVLSGIHSRQSSSIFPFPSSPFLFPSSPLPPLQIAHAPPEFSVVGIRNFAKDIVKLEEIIKQKM
jgi:hypothetical protein